MTLSVYNIKGGTGKTSISIQLAKILNLTYVSNDEEGGAYDVFEEDRAFLVKENEYKTIPFAENTLYDFGGFRTTQNIGEILKQSDVIVIPTLTSKGDIKGTLKMLKEVHSINQNVLVIINRVKANYSSTNKFEKPDILINYFNEELANNKLVFKNLNYALLREATIIEDGTFDGESVYDIANTKFKKHIYRNSIKDLDFIIKTLKRIIK